MRSASRFAATLNSRSNAKNITDEETRSRKLNADAKCITSYPRIARAAASAASGLHKMICFANLRITFPSADKKAASSACWDTTDKITVEDIKQRTPYRSWVEGRYSFKSATFASTSKSRS